ncbi:hypothetical protein HK101_010672 [Irineochytrium annulatum]|nr:hypothetical protein HK101_010672 [Irineochytrium annulatum]
MTPQHPCVIADEEYAAFGALVAEKLAAHPMLPSLSPLETRKHLLAHKGNKEGALKQVGSTLDWREGYGWATLLDDDFSDLVATGKLCFFRKDKEGNPILVWRHSRHVPPPKGDKSPTAHERDIRYIVYVLETELRGKEVDHLTIIIDRVGMSSANYDTPLVKALLATFQQYYPERLARLFIFPKSMILSAGFNVAKVFLDAFTLQKVHILGEDDYKKALLTYIDPDCLFQRLGGTEIDPYEDAVVDMGSSDAVSTKSKSSRWLSGRSVAKEG